VLGRTTSGKMDGVRRRADSHCGRLGHVFGNFRLEFSRVGKALVERAHVQLQVLGERSERFGREPGVVEQDRMPHLPQFALLGGAPRRARRGHRLRVDAFNRQIADDVPQFPGVDPLFLDLLVGGDVVLPAERALQIGVLDHRQRRVGFANHEAGHRRQADVVVDRRRRHR